MSTSTKRKRDQFEGRDQKPEEPEQLKKFCCQLCNVEVDYEVAAIKQHLLNPGHRKFNNADNEKKRVEDMCGIFVTGFTPSVDDDKLLGYFLKYGTIVWVHMDYSFLLLDYDNPASAAKVMNRTHNVAGRRLTIKYRLLRKPSAKKESQEENNEKLLPGLIDIPKFDMQIAKFMQTCQPSQNQYFKYKRIYQDLQNVLSNVFTDCDIQPFGSIVTGLNMNHSDVDVYVSEVNHDGDDITHLMRARDVMRNSRLFSRVFVISAKVPIVRCIHSPTRIKCDLTVKNNLGVCNSRLINYYMDIDEKLRKVMLVLKFWARTHKFTGQTHLFTNYSLCLMFIFFLQHAPFNFPSVLMLQQDQPLNPHDWDGRFKGIRCENVSIKDVSLLHLLKMFFNFYARYDFELNFVCPYVGYSIPKWNFIWRPDMLPNCFQRYHHLKYTISHLAPDTAVCVQDPFEQSRNTTLTVSHYTLARFVDYCHFGKNICGAGESQALFGLLSKVDEARWASQRPSIISAPTTMVYTTIMMRSDLRYLQGEYKTSRDRFVHWFDTVTDFTKMVFGKFFMCEIDHWFGSEKTEAEVDFKSYCGYYCKAKRDLWSDRPDYIDGKTDDTKGLVENQVIITEDMLTWPVDPEIEKLNRNMAEFELQLDYMMEPPLVMVNIDVRESFRGSFARLASIFPLAFATWFHKFEEELNESVN